MTHKTEVVNLLQQKMDEATDELAAGFLKQIFYPEKPENYKKPSLYKRIGRRFTRWLMDKFQIYEDY